jgi:hypothetical protein
MSDPRYSLAFRLCRLIKFQAHHCNAVSVVFVQNITQEAQFRFPVRGFTFMLQCLPKQGSMHPTNSFINKALKTFPWYTKSILMYCRRHGGTPVASTQQTLYYSEIRRFKERGYYRRKTEKRTTDSRVSKTISATPQYCHCRKMPTSGRPSGRPEISTHQSRLAGMWPVLQTHPARAPSHA